MATETFADQLNARLDQWTQGLAGQPGFEKFADADRSVTPLGPGTHGWLVTLEDGDETIGYMIIHAVKDGGFQLTEYGLGDYIPYAEQTLRQGLARLGLRMESADNTNKPFLTERLYLHPFYAVWRVETADGEAAYLDAVTGEVLPADDAAWQTAADTCPQQAPVRSPQHVLRAVSVEPFDPYERMPWLTAQPLPRGIGHLEKKLRQGAELRLTAETYEGAHRYVLSVTALQVWNDGTAYVGVTPDDQGSSIRFIAYRTVKPLAALYA